MNTQNSIVLQPHLISFDNTLTILISSMALGGAEWIVRDWISRISSSWRVHLVLLHNRDIEWPIPEGVTVTRLNGNDLVARLKIIGQTVAASSNRTCLAHLLSKDEQIAVESQGVFVYQVFHNARAGWLTCPTTLDKSKPVIAVSYACKNDLVDAGWTGDITVIHHLPRARNFPVGTRNLWRRRWRVPTEATVIGMIGSFKPQKDYRHALHILQELHNQGMKYYLVILGGLVGSKDRAEWRLVRSSVDELGLRKYVAMPGFISDAVQCSPAFDIVLNTSHYEGLSMATLEVLASGTPVVGSKVGGQGEVKHTNLTLVEKTRSNKAWTEAIKSSPREIGATPIWYRFPSYRLWTLFHLTQQFEPMDRVLFITANLNIGGAQRSLVNLVREINREDVSVAVTGDSYVDDFYRMLLDSTVDTFRSGDDGDPFANAENLIQYITQHKVGTIVFWNVDAKLKLLLTKVLNHSSVRFVDVSPGGYAFESLNQMDEFGLRICFSVDEYYRRLNDIVLKYNGQVPHHFIGNTSLISNGIPRPTTTKKRYHLSGAPKIVVCGRLAPSKFLLEILEAMRVVRETYPKAELHIYGGHRSSDREYVAAVHNQAGDHTVFHGMHFTAHEEYTENDVFVVLGRHQGCPNALLEALSVDMPVVANDDGGTREQVIEGETGCLIATVEPVDVAEAILSLLNDRDLAQNLGQSGRRHVLKHFSMGKMVQRYKELLWGNSASQQNHALTKAFN